MGFLLSPVPIILLVGAFTLFFATRGVAHEFKRTNRFRWVSGLMYLLIIVGAIGFLATTTGVVKLSTYREWPVGYARGVVTAADGKHFVPLDPLGRIQVYDSQWHFIRGWNVDARGGDFKVQYSPDGVIDVFTGKTQRHYSFTEDGRLISSTTILPEEALFLRDSPQGQSVVVPTSPVLWVFSSPTLLWGLIMTGFGGIAILNRRRAALSGL